MMHRLIKPTMAIYCLVIIIIVKIAEIAHPEKNLTDLFNSLVIQCLIIIIILIVWQSIENKNDKKKTDLKASKDRS